MAACEQYRQFLYVTFLILMNTKFISSKYTNKRNTNTDSMCCCSEKLKSITSHQTCTIARSLACYCNQNDAPT